MFHLKFFIFTILFLSSLSSLAQEYILDLSNNLLGKSKKEVLAYMKALGYPKPKKDSYGSGLNYYSDSSDGIHMGFKGEKLINISNFFYFESFDKSSYKLKDIIKEVSANKGDPRYYFGLTGIVPSETFALSDLKVNLLMRDDPNTHVYFWLLDDRTVYLSQNFGKTVKFSVELNPYYR